MYCFDFFKQSNTISFIGNKKRKKKEERNMFRNFVVNLSIIFAPTGRVAPTSKCFNTDLYMHINIMYVHTYVFMYICLYSLNLPVRSTDCS